MSIQVRTMTPKDKPAIMQILRNTKEFKSFEVAVAEELIDAYLEDPHGSGYPTLVAVLDSETAGYICYGPTPLTEGTWDIYWMAVAPDRQRNGLGAALLEQAEKNIDQAKGRITLIETSSTPLYEKARSFYSRQGYKRIAVVPDFYEPGDDKIIYLKKLR